MRPAELAGTLSMPLSTLSRDPHSDRDGEARPARARAAAALRALAAGRACPPRRQGAGADHRRRSARDRRVQLPNRPLSPPRRREPGWEYVHIAVHDYTAASPIADVLHDEKPPPSASCAARS